MTLSEAHTTPPFKLNGQHYLTWGGKNTLPLINKQYRLFCNNYIFLQNNLQIVWKIQYDLMVWVKGNAEFLWKDSMGLCLSAVYLCMFPKPLLAGD